MRGKPFTTGNKANPKGRGKGTLNKVTRDKRELISEILDNHIDKLDEIIEDTAITDPHRAFKMILDLLEFSIPKVKSVDLNVLNEEPFVPIKGITFNPVDPE